MTCDWYEVRLRTGVQATDFIESLGSGYGHVHAFWDEPWWPGAYVVRVRVPEGIRVHIGGDDVVSCDPWDATPDAELYGDAWPQVQRLFEAGTRLADHDLQMATRMVHCLLNARGMSEFDEARWALRFAWNRLTIKLRWRFYLRRRWERQRVAA